MVRHRIWKSAIIGCALLIAFSETWADQGFRDLHTSGEFLYRHESVKTDHTDPRNRHQLELSVGLSGKLEENLGLGLQLATESSLGDAYSRKPIEVDLAYLEWTQMGFTLTAGKMANPFFRTEGAELVWDSDLSPEGLAVGWKGPIFGTTDLFVTGSGFWVEESASEKDLLMNGVQTGLDFKIGKSTLVLGSSYYHYTSDSYQLIEGFAALNTSVFGLPSTLFFECVTNAGATTEATGWLTGFTLGETGRLRYDYRVVETNAVLGDFADAEFAGGRTGAKGHRLTLEHPLTDVLRAGLTLYLNQLGQDPGYNYRKLQIDLTAQF